MHVCLFACAWAHPIIFPHYELRGSKQNLPYIRVAKTSPRKADLNWSLKHENKHWTQLLQDGAQADSSTCWFSCWVARETSEVSLTWWHIASWKNKPVLVYLSLLTEKEWSVCVKGWISLTLTLPLAQWCLYPSLPTRPASLEWSHRRAHSWLLCQ